MPGHREYLLGSGAIVPAIRVRDMGTDTTYAEGVGQFPPWGSPQADETETVEGAVQSLGLTPTGGCNVGGRVAGGGDLRLLPR